jgi:hypothetical protein
MKVSLLLSLILAVVGVTAGRGEDDLPKRFNFSRYQAMLDHSPFAVATAVALPAATPQVFKDLYVANVAHTPEADLVTIVSSADKNLKEYLSTAGPNEHGYAVSNIEWSDQPGATKVTISKDGKFATLSFNEALLSAPLPTVRPQPQPQRILPRGNPAVNVPKIPRPIRIPALPTPTPHVRGVIPRNPASNVHPPTER